MFHLVNPPLTVPSSAPVGGTLDKVGFEYAYWREIEGEPRSAQALGRWADVWDRVDAALTPSPSSKPPRPPAPE